MDGRGRLVVTFVTAAYDVLCDNFVRHLAALDLRAYLLVTFDRAQHDRLERRGEPVYLRLLPQLKSGGSDQFASRDFFLINSARYAVLIALLRGGDGCDGAARRRASLIAGLCQRREGHDGLPVCSGGQLTSFHAID